VPIPIPVRIIVAQAIAIAIRAGLAGGIGSHDSTAAAKCNGIEWEMKHTPAQEV